MGALCTLGLCTLGPRASLLTYILVGIGTEWTDW